MDGIAEAFETASVPVAFAGDFAGPPWPAGCWSLDTEVVVEVVVDAVAGEQKDAAGEDNE